MIRKERDTHTSEVQELRRAVEDLQGAAGLRDSLTSVEDFARQLADLTTSEIARFSAATRKEKEALLKDLDSRCVFMEDLAEQHLRIQGDLSKRQSEAIQRMDQFAGDSMARIKNVAQHVDSRSPTRTVQRQVQPLGVRRFVSDGPRHLTSSLKASDGAKIPNGGEPNLVDGFKVVCSEDNRPKNGREFTDPGHMVSSGLLAQESPLEPPPCRPDSSPGRRADMSPSPFQKGSSQAIPLAPGSLRAPINGRGHEVNPVSLTPRLIFPWRHPATKASATAGAPGQPQPPCHCPSGPDAGPAGGQTPTVFTAPAHASTVALPLGCSTELSSILASRRFVSETPRAVLRPK
jgi:hypothetical protein